MKVLAYFMFFVSAIWFIELGAYILTDWEPNALTIGVALFSAGILTAKWGIEYLQEAR